MIPYGRQDISDADIESVIAVLRSDYLTQGPCVPQFEKKVLDYCGAKYAVAVNSATSALHIACLSLGLGAGDRLWTSPITFVASANCGRYCGAEVDFVDIDPETFNISVVALEKKLAIAKQQGKLPKILVAVHFAGQSCDMQAMRQLSKQYGFAIIEDASHAIGAMYQQSRVGSCQYSDITVFSFHPVKIITTGEGGMALSNSEQVYERLLLLRSHGITRNPKHLHNPCHQGWYYEQQDLGYNYRMTELQAALGISQMDRLEEFLLARRVRVERYHQQLARLPLQLPMQASVAESAWHLYVVRVDRSKTSLNRQQLYDRLISKGIGVNVHYIPVHTQPYYHALGFRQGDFPVAERYYENALSLPLFSRMALNEQDIVINAICESID